MAKNRDIISKLNIKTEEIYPGFYNLCTEQCANCTDKMENGGQVCMTSLIEGTCRKSKYSEEELHIIKMITVIKNEYGTKALLEYMKLPVPENCDERYPANNYKTLSAEDIAILKNGKRYATLNWLQGIYDESNKPLELKEA